MRCSILLHGIILFAVHATAAKLYSHRAEAVPGSYSPHFFTARNAIPAASAARKANHTHHIDTIHDTHGVPTPADLHAAKYRTFCTATAHTRVQCNSIIAYLDQCGSKPINVDHGSISSPTADQANAGLCRDSDWMALLRSTIDLRPCRGLNRPGADRLKYKICSEWMVEAERCRDKTVRGPCSEYHIRYMFRELIHFFGLGEHE